MSDPKFGRSAKDFLLELGIRGSTNQNEESALGEDPAFPLKGEERDVGVRDSLEDGWIDADPSDRIRDLEDVGGSIRSIFARDPLYREAKERAHTYLGLQVKPSGAVRKKLLALNYPSSLVEEVIRALTEQGFLKDEELIRRVIAVRSRGRKSEGRAVLSQRLRQQGFPPDLIREVLLNTLPPAEDLAERFFRGRYTKLLQKLYWRCEEEGIIPSSSALRDDPELIRAIRAGCRRGFAPGQCYRAIDLIFSEVETGSSEPEMAESDAGYETETEIGRKYD